MSEQLTVEYYPYLVTSDGLSPDYKRWVYPKPGEPLIYNRYQEINIPSTHLDYLRLHHIRIRAKIGKTGSW